MIGQCLSNKNEIATVPKTKNKAEDSVTTLIPIPFVLKTGYLPFSFATIIG